MIGSTSPLTHSSTLSWKIPWTEKPGRLQSMGSQRVGHDWATSLSMKTNWNINFLWAGTVFTCFCFFLKAPNIAMDFCLCTDVTFVYLNGVCSNQKDFMEILKFQEPFLSLKKWERELPSWSSGKDTTVWMQGVWVQTLLRELDPTCHN